MNKHFLNKRLAHQLGFAGLVPFVLMALACWIVGADVVPSFVTAQQVFSIVILSFLGGIHWGATMVSGELSAEQTKRALGWSVVPTMIACLGTMFGAFDLAVLIAGFLGSYQVDKRLYKWYKLADWFIRLRFILTCVVVAALLITMVAANTRG
jgi:hypothetical protein